MTNHPNRKKAKTPSRVFRVEIRCDNAAFGENAEAEIGRILECVALEVYDQAPLEDGAGEPVRDVMGNTVGRWVIAIER